jgi:hypothetical protein
MDGVAVAPASVPAVFVHATLGVSTTAPHGLLFAGWAMQMVATPSVASVMKERAS